MKRLFSRDEATGISKYWHVTGEGEYVIETVQDSTKIIEANKSIIQNNKSLVKNDFSSSFEISTIFLFIYFYG